MKKFFNAIISLLKRFFTPINLSKVIVIFFVGLISRFLINDLLGINVFTDYLSWISITYYSGFAAFIVFIHEFFSFFKISIIPDFIWVLCSKLGQILEYLFVRPYIWVYSRTLGKNVHIFHMNNPRNSSSSIYIGSDQHHYSSVRSYNVNTSYYNNIAQQNPYQAEYSSVNRIPHPSHYPPQEYDSNYNQEYVDHNVSQYSNNYYNTQQSFNEEDSSRFFYIDTIEQDGIDRSFITPVNQPDAPRMSNNTTPRTMTPLFGSTEQVHQYSVNQTADQHSYRNSEASVAYTNDTTHATLGPNRSEAHINWPARRYQISRAIGNGLEEGQFFNEELRVPSSQIQGKLKVGIRFQDEKSNIQSLYVKYRDLAKRKFFWNIWEKNHGEYNSYEEFKENFDPKMNIWKEIAKTTRGDSSKDIHDFLEKNPFQVKRSKISPRDIRRVNYLNAQERLNEMNAKRYKSTRLPKK